MRQAVSLPTSQRALPGAHLTHLAHGSVALLSGPYGSGKATLVAQWLAATGQRPLWCTPTRTLPRATAAPDSAPDVLVVRLIDAGGQEAQFLLDCRRRWPDASLVVLSPYGWPSALRDSDLRVEVAITGRALCFTPEQIAAWALECSVPITEAQAEEIAIASGGYAVAVHAVVQAAVETGGYDQGVLARGCDRGVAELAAAASAGVVPWALWEVFLYTAQAGQLTVAATEALWSTAPDGLDALRAMRHAGLIGERDGAGYLGLASGLREACRRRIGTDLSPARRAEVCGALADSFAVTGKLDDAVSLLRGSELAAPRLEFMARHWLRLHELPAASVRDLLDRVGPNSDPRLLLAHARAILDVLQRDHPGHVTLLDRARGHTLLDQARSSIERLDPSAQAVLQSLTAIEKHRSDRIEAGTDPNGTEVGRVLSSAPVASLAHPGLAIHEGLSALSEGHATAAGRLFAGAAHGAHGAGLTRLSEIADYLGLLTERLSADPLPVRQAPVAPPGAGAAWPQAQRIARLIGAVETLDAPVLHEVLVRSGDAPIADEPVILNVLQIYVEALALVAVGHARTALAHLEVASSAMTYLTEFEQGILLLTRATVLAAGGESAAAWTVLAAAPPDQVAHGDIELLRTQVLIAHGADDEALGRLREAIGRSEDRLGRKSTWAQVLRSVAHRRRGEQEASDRALTVAVMAAARSNLLFPFARQGRGELTAIVAQAQRLDLDASSRELVDRLAGAHDALRSIQRPVPLSEREAVLLAALVDIDSVRRLGRELHVSPNTVKTQLRNLYRKLEVSSRAEALRVGRLMRLIPAADTGAAPAENQGPDSR